MKRTIYLSICLLVVWCLLTGCGTKPQPEPQPPLDEHTHAWDDGTVILAASCIQEGRVRYACTSCDETREESIPITDHVLDAGEVVIEAGCGKAGALLKNCTACDHFERVSIPATGNHAWDEGTIYFAPGSSEGSMIYQCTGCSQSKQEPLDPVAYAAMIEDLKQKIASFDAEDFGGTEITTDLVEAAAKKGKTYQKPPISPTAGVHPRLLFTKEDIPGMVQAMTLEENLEAVALFERLVATPTTGNLAEPKLTNPTRGDFHNFSPGVLEIIQAKALCYQLTGSELRGYEAIYAIKNYIRTLDIRYIYSDQCRQYGYVMYMTALVYDWCYDLLTEKDKQELIAGVEHLLCTGVTPGHDGKVGSVRMEVGFPPVHQGSISGHGTECQILRDYLSFSIAVYDELPTWWEMIGGRFYQDYVPARNVFYAAGMYPQGISNYAHFRYIADVWSAWLIKGFSGSVPYVAEDMKQIIHSMFSFETTEKYIFSAGDFSSATKTLHRDLRTCALISSYLFDDPVARRQATRISSGLSKFNADVAAISVSEFLICSSDGLTCADDPHEGYPMILYHDGYLQQIIARNSWGANNAAVLMRLGERTTANHDHQDAGTFQIWYKAMLAGDTGCYVGYGTDHHYHYHQATIAHNGLLIYNPAYTGTRKGYYCGGQRQMSEASNLDGWQNSDVFRCGELSGVAYAYFDEEQKQPHYAYIAGDIAAAYDADTVNEVTRRMLTIYTGDEKFPMVFVVYDHITAQDGSFQKTFLLHTLTEPTVDGKTITTASNGGKLVLQNLIGGDRIVTIGGPGKNYQINGKQLEPQSPTEDGFWGRVEISPAVGNRTDMLLNVMYVTDASNEEAAVATALEADGAVGTRIMDIVALFVPESMRSIDTIRANATGEGDLKYYVSGVAAGTWIVLVDGKEISTVTATEDGGFLHFTAPAGQLELRPGSDIRPANSDVIQYNTNDGTLPADTAQYYEHGKTFTLPEPMRQGAIFLGWYTSPNFASETKITEIDAITRGKVTVYAKWLTDVIRIRFNTAFETTTEGWAAYDAIKYLIKTGARASHVVDANGDGYLLWEKGSTDPQINCERSMAAFLKDQKAVTFTISLAKNGTDTPLRSEFRLRGTTYSDTVFVFETFADGTVKVGDTTVMTLTETLQTLTFTVDFEKSTITVYNESGVKIAEVAFSAPQASSATTAEQWMKTLTQYMFNWYFGGSASGSIRVGGIDIYAGTIY